MNQTIKEVIDIAKNIAVIGHLGPDPDSECATLFITNILNENFKEKKAYAVVSGGATNSLRALRGFNEIEKDDILEVLKSKQIDLLIVVDVSSSTRVSSEPEKLREYVKENGVNVIVIDHHSSEKSSDLGGIYVNNGASSVCFESYNVFIKELGLKPYPQYFNELITGIWSDTGGLTYSIRDYEEVLKLYKQFIDEGLVIEVCLTALNEIEEKDMKILKMFFDNFTVKDRYTYSYITYEQLSAVDCTPAEMKKNMHRFIDEFVKNTDKKFGFVIYPDVTSTLKNVYKGSFRSQSGHVDTTVFAKQLSGGGHIFASGISIDTTDVKEAVERVEKVIESSFESAIL